LSKPEKDFLLTYRYELDYKLTFTDFSWFGSEEELINGIERLKANFNGFMIIDAIEIIKSKDLDMEGWLWSN